MLHLLVRGLQLFVDPFALDEDGWAIQLSCLSSADGHSTKTWSKLSGRPSVESTDRAAPPSVGGKAIRRDTRLGQGNRKNTVDEDGHDPHSSRRGIGFTSIPDILFA
jgi:hypothetical protein